LTSNVHDGVASRQHVPDLSGLHFSAISVGHDVPFSRAHDPQTSSIPPADYSTTTDMVLDSDGAVTHDDGATSTPLSLESTSTPFTLTSFQPTWHGPTSTEPFVLSALNAHLIMFDNDFDAIISAGDDFVLDNNKNGVYDEGIDDVILDIDSSLVDTEPGVCSLNAVGDLLSVYFRDTNLNGWYDLGEDIIIDANRNLLFDPSGPPQPYVNP